MQNSKRENKLTEEHIAELQRRLVRTCIDFIIEKGISDLEEVRFNCDELQDSANFGSWQPCTDSWIGGYGYVSDEYGVIVRSLLKEYM